MEASIWLAAGFLYLLFRAWYDNWRGPLTAQEVDQFMARAQDLGIGANHDLTILNDFLIQDDGREFFMTNLVRVEPGLVRDPSTGQEIPGAQVLAVYTRAFLRRLFLTGGHPALAK